jgi:T-complex protein 1 subunit delta
VSQYSTLLAPIAVDAVMRVINPATAENVDLQDIRIVKKVGGTIDDTELVEGLVLNQSVIKNAGGPTRMEKAKIGLIQFQLSPPKPDVSWLIYYAYNSWKIRSSSMTIDRWIRSSKRNGFIF